ncbi:pre-mRNA-splicing factor 38B-like [Paramacrobiotus metropolitanus]|uniref:pre-mRNA-splicing factor 38B-like n=1 Tax=Paramacrobiotus metropolitanus TaxID=2943436 RepID=UPI0024457D6C|nr:pre-mRNA-splicing factor 38B-like [Paramacrobiotus metropolitanus]XP_055327162.1 pre-mRNA-splicing factor 38B-like [Paramacrobiotus metropolitanus]
MAEEEDQSGGLEGLEGGLQGGGPRKKGNILPIWGNEKTMNLNNMILTNIQQSPYYKVTLGELRTYHEIVDEIYNSVNHLEPWEKGSRRTSGQIGMCGGVRGVGAGGIVSSAFCLVYKLFTTRLTRKQLNSLINHQDSPFLRGVGFMYIRYCQPPADLWEWYEPYLDDKDEVDPKAGGGDYMTIGQMVRHFLTRLDWYGTLFPRIPVPIQKLIDQKLTERRQQEMQRFNRPADRRDGGPREHADRSAGSQVPVEKDNRRRSPERVGKRSPSPRRSPMRGGRRPPSPARRKRSPSPPRRRRSPSPRRKRSASPAVRRKRSPSPKRKRSPSPDRDRKKRTESSRAVSPGRSKRNEGNRKKSASPVRIKKSSSPDAKTRREKLEVNLEKRSASPQPKKVSVVNASRFGRNEAAGETDDLAALIEREKERQRRSKYEEIDGGKSTKPKREDGPSANDSDAEAKGSKDTEKEKEHHHKKKHKKHKHHKHDKEDKVERVSRSLSKDK